MSGVVMKFGGTSVADADAIGRVIDIVARRVDDFPIVVVSALSKVTDRLIAVTELARAGDETQAVAELEGVLQRHLGLAAALTDGDGRTTLESELTAMFADLAVLVRALARQRDVSPKMHDAIVAAGELASSRVVAAGLSRRGVPAVWIDAREVMTTDAEHTAAVPDMQETERRCQTRVAVSRSAGSVPVLGGFIGSTLDGVTTTLGRGGSDYSAAIFGACLNVDEIEIWTDVDGMLTADPRIVADPQLVAQLSFAEASELAYFGAKVLHPSTILPAIWKNIPVRILNSRRPENTGTSITANASSSQGPLTAIACKRGVTVVDITSSRMLMAHGFLRRLFEVFERFKTPVDVVTTSEVSVSVTVDNAQRLASIVEELKTFAEVATEPEMAIVCAVGEHLIADPTVFARAVTALDGVPLRLVSQAASRRNFTFVIRDRDVQAAMNALHRSFFAGERMIKPAPAAIPT